MSNVNINIAPATSSFTWSTKGGTRIVHEYNHENGKSLSRYEVDSINIKKDILPINKDTPFVLAVKGDYRFTLDESGKKSVVKYFPSEKSSSEINLLA